MTLASDERMTFRAQTAAALLVAMERMYGISREDRVERAVAMTDALLKALDKPEAR